MIISDKLNNILIDIINETQSVTTYKSPTIQELATTFLNTIKESNKYEAIDLARDFYFSVTSQNITTEITMAKLIEICKVGKSNMYGSFYMRINKEKNTRYPHINEEYLNSVKITAQPNKPTNKEKTDEEQLREIINSGEKITLDNNWTPNPLDIKNVFLSLVSQTYPYETEHKLEPLLKSLIKGDLQKDDFGNYYIIVGDNPTVMFTSHLDTKSEKEENVTVVKTILKGHEIWFSDGTTILGADDKAGVAAMLYMIENNVNGLYYFFIGEEVGGLGSNHIAENYYNYPYLSTIKKVISFDRRNKYSIITHQRFGRCCSDEFADALGKQLDMKKDENGMFTDSANFTDIFPENTNISVGYDREHTNLEYQNISFLVSLCEKLIKVDWNGLPVKRNNSFSNDILAKYQNLIMDLYDINYINQMSLRGFEKSIQLTVTFETTCFDSIYFDIKDISECLKKHNVEKTHLIMGLNSVRIYIY